MDPSRGTTTLAKVFLSIEPLDVSKHSMIIHSHWVVTVEVPSIDSRSRGRSRYRLRLLMFGSSLGIYKQLGKLLGRRSGSKLWDSI